MTEQQLPEIRIVSLGFNQTKQKASIPCPPECPAYQPPCDCQPHVYCSCDVEPPCDCHGQCSCDNYCSCDPQCSCDNYCSCDSQPSSNALHEDQEKKRVSKGTKDSPRTFFKIAGDETMLMNIIQKILPTESSPS